MNKSREVRVTAGGSVTPAAASNLWAMPFRPALPMNRAVFHRLGLTVGIAIAWCDRG